MTAAFDKAIGQLTDVQRQAVDWSGGPLLVLAGPGSGKTQIITCRMASLLAGSPKEHFRLLALTFTNKAASEMRRRVSDLAGELEHRATIETFHGFCVHVLRQHGVHIGIQSDFAVVGDDADRRAVLADALRPARTTSAIEGGINYLPTIDYLKSILVAPDSAASALSRADSPEQIIDAYRRYDEELHRLNALDFSSLLFETHRLFTTFPTLAARYRQIYPYVLVDEFQDTNAAQYELLRVLVAGLPNLMVVADDDQIIYEWNGASFKRIEALIADVGAHVLQLPTNHRCPESIVAAANKLVVYNAQRSSLKAPVVAGRHDAKYPPDQQIQTRVFDDEEAEARGVAREITEAGRSAWPETVVLARTRALLNRVFDALAAEHVPAVIAQRRDEFLSPQFRLLVVGLRQIARPLDLRAFSVLIDSFNRMSPTEASVEDLRSLAETTGRGYFESWMEVARSQFPDGLDAAILETLREISSGLDQYSQLLETLLQQLAVEVQRENPDQETKERLQDIAEDVSAWRSLADDIRLHCGAGLPLDAFLQELQMRSKESPPMRGSVTLMTIHSAKGREFESVYLIGLAEDILPSFQSKQKQNGSPALEEERRNCFVAITRTKERLVLSRARRYRGWIKEPSRFLAEMGY